LTIELVRSWVLNLEPMRLENLEHLEQTKAIFPNTELRDELLAFKEANDATVLPWGVSEAFLLGLVDTRDFIKRSDCCIISARFESRFKEVEADLLDTRSCLQSLVKSESIPSIFGLIIDMGNYLNFGSNRGAQKGFTLETLSVMMRVEGFADKSYTLMRFLMDTLEGNKALRDSALEDMKLCVDVSRLDYPEMMRQLRDITKSVQDVHAIVKPGDSPPHPDGLSMLEDAKFEDPMRTFVSESEERLKALQTMADESAELLTKCQELFVEKKSVPLGETLKKIAQFKKDMEEARRQNLLAKAKKDKAEKKRVEREEAQKVDGQLFVKKALPHTVKQPRSDPLDLQEDDEDHKHVKITSVISGNPMAVMFSLDMREKKASDLAKDIFRQTGIHFSRLMVFGPNSKLLKGEDLLLNAVEA